MAAAGVSNFFSNRSAASYASGNGAAQRRTGELEMLDEADIQRHADRIRDDGYTVIERAADAKLVDGLIAALLRIEREHNLGNAKTSFEGFKTVRINNLLTYDDLFWEVPLHANVLPVVERVLDKECLLSSFCSLILGPGQEAQPIHEDTQLIPLPRPHIPITLNAIWALSDFNHDNGSTRIIPGSHRYDHSPEYGKDYDAVTATMPAGSVMLFDSALWHGGGANVSSGRRFAFSCAYCWGWMRQQENLQLGIARETAQRFPRRLQELCGYSVYKGQFGHIDNRDPIELLGRERGKRMVWEATDVRSARLAQAAKQ
jgi:ectoine hydroxylase-related dioxygenase (phytanoyl-CoA dioxygenase family)